MDTTSITIRTAGHTVTLRYCAGRSHSQTPTHTMTGIVVALTIMVTATRTGSLIVR